MKTSIYISEADQPLIERAKSEIGEGLSGLFIDCIRRRLAERDRKDEMREIVLSFCDEKGQPSVKKQFRGRWLFGSETEGVWIKGWDQQRPFSVALTERGQIAIYAFGTATLSDGAAATLKRMQVDFDAETTRLEAEVRSEEEAILNLQPFPSGSRVRLGFRDRDRPKLDKEPFLSVYKSVAKLEQDEGQPVDLRMAVLRELSREKPIELDI